MIADEMPAGARARFGTVFLEAERRGIKGIVYGRTIALAIIAIWVGADNGLPQGLYYLGLLAVFFVLGWAMHWLSRGGHYAPWTKYAFMATDAALLAFTLLVPNPLSDLQYDIQLQLRFGNFPYMFVILVVAALMYSPLFAVWSGLCCAIAWGVGVGTILAWPDTRTWADLPANPSSADFFGLLLDPKFVLVNARITEILVLLIVAGILALAAWQSRRLVLAQAVAERARTNLARYFSPNMVEEVARADAPLGTVREQNAAVLFADMVGFTELSAGQPPAAVIGLLRDFHARLARQVFAHDGTLDKFTGDGLMATFGTPVTRPDDGLRSLRCARAMIDAIERWNIDRVAAGAAPVRLGVGVHYGPVVAGDIGDVARLEYAVVGDTVNVASRLERLTRELDVDLVISDALLIETKSQTAAEAPAAGLAPKAGVALRGREQQVLDVWILERDPAPAEIA